jgi:hypothetical protein
VNFTKQEDLVRRAVPILLGTPYSSDPRFSPLGDRIIFRSDAVTGMDNVWMVPWDQENGCQGMDLRPDQAESVFVEMTSARYV